MDERLWTRVEDALDRRVDPFDEPGLGEALRADPRAARAARSLLGRLDALAELEPPAAIAATPRARARDPRRVAAAALLAVAAVAAVLVRGRSSSDADAPARPPSTVKLVVEHVTPPPARGARVVLEPRRVLGWTLEGETP